MELDTRYQGSVLEMQATAFKPSEEGMGGVGLELTTHKGSPGSSYQVGLFGHRVEVNKENLVSFLNVKTELLLF